MRATRELHLKLSAEQQKLLEDWLSEFERDWTPHKLPQWQRRLQSQPPELVEAAMVELVKIDLERNWQAGKRESLAAYLDKYPSLGDRATVPPELIQAEVEVRKQFGAAAGHDFLAAEYPGREGEWRSFLDVAVTVKPAAVTMKAAADTSQAANESLMKSVEQSSPAAARYDQSGLPKTFGRYRLLKVLGRGGMGSVYLAEDTALNRRCAIKMPHFDKKRDREILERFTREAQTAASVRHENICTIYDVGEIDGEQFISMEMIEGRPLTDFISPSRPGRQRATVQMLLKLALALKHAHEEQIVHRDLKPANVMIKGRSHPVIMDFGLACSLEVSDKSRATAEGTILGTPAYMSPEQVRGHIKDIGPRSDIYSLGVILYEMLTGQVPFRGSVQAILGQILGEEPAPLRELRPDIDLDLQAICLKMMAKSPAKRYQSMGEVADALTEWLRRVNAGVDGSKTLIGTAPFSSPAASPTLRIDADSQPTVVRLFPATKPRIDEEVDPKPQTILTAPTYVRRKPTPRSSIGLWLAGGVLLLLGVIVIITRGNNGTLRIEVSDDVIDVMIDGDEVRFADQRGEIDLTDGGHDLNILVAGTEVAIGDEFALSTEERDGEYRLVVQLGDTELSGDRFTFNRDGETALTVELVEAEKETSVSSPEAAPNDTHMVADDTGNARANSGVVAVTEFSIPIADEMSLPWQLELSGGRHVRALAFSRDSRRMAVAQNFRYPVLVYQLDTDEVPVSLPLENPDNEGVLSLAFSDESLIAITADGGKRRRLTWSAPFAGEHIVELIADDPYIGDLVAFASEARVHALGTRFPSAAQQERAIEIFNLTTDVTTQIAARDGRVTALALSHDGGMVSVVHDNGMVALWDVAKGELFREFAGVPYATWTGFSHDSKYLGLIGDRSIAVWDTSTHERIAYYSDDRFDNVYEQINPMGPAVWSPQQDVMLVLCFYSGGPDGHDSRLGVFDVERGWIGVRGPSVEEYHAGNTCLNISPDGSVLCIADHDQLLLLDARELLPQSASPEPPLVADTTDTTSDESAAMEADRDVNAESVTGVGDASTITADQIERCLEELGFTIPAADSAFTYTLIDGGAADGVFSTMRISRPYGEPRIDDETAQGRQFNLDYVRMSDGALIEGRIDHGGRYAFVASDDPVNIDAMKELLDLIGNDLSETLQRIQLDDAECAENTATGRARLVVTNAGVMLASRPTPILFGSWAEEYSIIVEDEAPELSDAASMPGEFELPPLDPAAEQRAVTFVRDVKEKLADLGFEESEWVGSVTTEIDRPITMRSETYTHASGLSVDIEIEECRVLVFVPATPESEDVVEQLLDKLGSGLPELHSRLTEQSRAADNHGESGDFELYLTPTGTVLVHDDLPLLSFDEEKYGLVNE